MKAILFILLLFSNFSLQGNTPIKFSIELPDTIYKDQHDIPIILKIENTSPLLITIKNPKYWGNVFPHLTHEHKDIPLIKVRMNLRLLEETIVIRGNDILKIPFVFTLDEMASIDFLPSGKYDLYFELQGKKPIKSEVKTFYLK